MFRLVGSRFALPACGDGVGPIGLATLVVETLERCEIPLVGLVGPRTLALARPPRALETRADTLGLKFAWVVAHRRT